MDNEGFREFYAAFTEAGNTISSVETLGAQIEDGERSAHDGLLIGLGLVAVAKAIQAQTLGLRLSAKEGR